MKRLKDKEELSGQEYEDLQKRTKEELESLEAKKKAEIDEINTIKGDEIYNLKGENKVYEESIRAKEGERDREEKLKTQIKELKHKLEMVQIKNVDEKVIFCYLPNVRSKLHWRRILNLLGITNSGKICCGSVKMWKTSKRLR